MSKLKNFFSKTALNLKTTIFRFPFVLAMLLSVTIIIGLLIENTYPNDTDLLSRLLMSGIFGAFFGITAEFLFERFEKILKYRWILPVINLAVTVLYFFLMTSPVITAITVIKLIVCCFALFALYLYIPSAKGAWDFNKTALIHFKAAFTALLYGAVIFLGSLAIYFAIDVLLFKLDRNIIAHLANIVFLFFVPIYYLSLLPKFNSTNEVEIERSEKTAIYPRFLEILVSYISIPLITVFTAVLVAYFLKIIFTLVWPIGVLGPMILAYSAVGLFIYILCGRLDNKFALLFRKLFPIFLIPIVCLQMVSVYIRVNAYGITESRYYVILFAVFSIICSLYLIFSKIKKSGMIALLAACFAIFSILPFVNAFNVSRVSQTIRVENILIKNNMLSGNTLTPKSNISDDDKREITNIIFYLNDMGYLNNVKWLETEYKNNEIYSDFQKIFGFESYNKYNIPDNKGTHINVILNEDLPLDITGFEKMIKFDFNTTNQTERFSIAENEYSFKESFDKNEINILLLDKSKKTVLNISLKDLFIQISERNGSKELPAGILTLDISNNELKIRIIIERLSMYKSNNDEFSEIYGNAIILIGKK